MQAEQRTILFLGHSASRNGASILLLHLLQWLRQNTSFRFEVLLLGGGPLVNEFRAVATTHVVRDPLSVLRKLNRTWASALSSQLEHLLIQMRLQGRRYDLVYANTAATWRHVAALGRHRSALLWHIHELAYALDLTLDETKARELLRSASRVIGVSTSVVDTLVKQYSVTADRVDLVHGFVPLAEVSEGERRLRRRRLLERLNWPSHAFVVGGCGGLGWRKGTDLFLQLASRFKRNHPSSPVRFLWVGGSERGGSEVLQFEHDLHRMELADVCRRVASTADVDAYYDAMDVFALTSREDPFPLVMLEAAVHAVPTVCFKDAGGGPEFVAGDAGIAVPYLDLDAFMEALRALQADPELRRVCGLAAQRKVRHHHGIEAQGPKLLLSIQRCMAGD
ncbi:glycosyltransferase family 4 protein [Azohydromonas australica]|uniref:glycosyltransferase family 4 protein n=1 Tax=Azohydromonas australica TaxID=364039 RepID=UPI0004200303|nr:glycosyltransferase family 4 protein [Azohydromonas australica]